MLDHDAVMVTATFDQARYHGALFEHWKLGRPPGIERMVHRRQAHFLAGRIVAARGLAELGFAERDCGRGPLGQPIWPAGTTGSISHIDGRCAAIICRDPGRLCGIDMEHIAEGDALHAIFKQCLSYSEAALVRSQGAHPAPVAATALFSAKETLFKALFPRVQRFFGFDAAEALAPPAPDKIVLRLTQDLAVGLRRGQDFEITLCVRPDHVRTALVAPANPPENLPAAQGQD